MEDDTYKLYMTASVNKDRQCNIVKPFAWSTLEADYNPVTKKPNTPEDITALKQAIIRANNSTGGEIVTCCKPNLKESDIGSSLLSKYKGKFPSVREITKNGVLDYIEVSTKPQNMAQGWKVLTPYILCKLGKSVIEQTSTPDIYKAVALAPDCYTADCNGKTTLTLDHLFNSVKADLTYTYYDDARVVQAIKSGDVSGVENYLRKSNDANLVLTHDDYENRIIHIASMYYKPKVLDLILTVKPNLNAKNVDGNTPLHLACKYGNLDIVERFVKLGVELNPKNNKGETPIMLGAVYKGQAPNGVDTDSGVNGMIVRYLYNNGASILDVDKAGNNILHHLIQNGQDSQEKSRLVRFLLERGANADQANSAGLTPLELTAKLLAKYESPEPTLSPAQLRQYAKSAHNLKPRVPGPAFKKNSPFPIKTMTHESSSSNITKTRDALQRNTVGMGLQSHASGAGVSSTGAYLDALANPAKSTSVKSVSVDLDNNVIETDINSGAMDRLKLWLYNISPSITVSETLLGTGNKPTKPSTTTFATTPTTTKSSIPGPTISNTPATTIASAGGNPATTKGVVEPFQAEVQDIAKMPARQRELMEIQSLLFNDIVRNNEDKYKSYINVADLPKGAPIDVLDHMCSGESPDIQGIESKAECIAKGGNYIKIKNPTTLVKVELIPESDRVIDAVPEEELYYNKFPAEELVQPLPHAKINKSGPTKKPSSGKIKTNEMFTDFSDTYVSRDPLVGQLVNQNELTGAGIGYITPETIYQISNQQSSIANQQVNNSNSQHPVINTQLASHFANVARHNADVLTPEISASTQANNKWLATLRSNWQLVLSAVILVIILLIVISIWFDNKRVIKK